MDTRRLRAGLVGQRARGDRLGNAAALRVLKVAVGEEDGERKAERRDHERCIAPVREKIGERDLRSVGEQGQDDGGSADRHAADDECGAPPPPSHCHCGRTPRSFGRDEAHVEY
jgi:hypothetical protein